MYRHQDDTIATVISLATLNPAPLTPAQRITIRDGHFYDQSGRRVRFVGLNLKALPSKEELAPLAARWHQEGINLIRLVAPAPESQSALAFFCAELKKQGIYLNLVLRTTGSVRDYFDPSTLAQQTRQAAALLSTTGLANDPVLALVTLNGTCSLVGSAAQLDRLPPTELKPLQAAWNLYLKKKYVTTAQLRQRWGGPASVPAHQSLEAGTLELSHVSGIPAGIDYTHFLMTLEDTYCRTLKNAIRATGCLSPLACSSASAGGIAGVWREAKLDWLELQDPMEDSSLDFFAMHRVGGKPYIVQLPSPALMPLFFAYAAWQDWDGVFVSDQRSFLPAGASLFLRGDLAPARSAITLTVPQNKIPTITALGSAGAFWGLAEIRFVQGELTQAPEKAEPQTFVTHRAEVRFERDPGPLAFGVQAFPSAPPGFLWDSGKEQFRVSSPASKALIGKLGGSAARVTGFVAELAPPVGTQATLLLTSRDGKPTEDASSLLLTTTINLTAVVHIATKATSASVWALDSTGKRQSELPSRLENGTLTLQLDHASQAGSYELVLTHAPASP